jgi:tRNA A37 methylthiotransferase MiaB
MPLLFFDDSRFTIYEVEIMNKVGFISLGCPKNLVDSEVMMGQLKANGYELTGDASEADTLVVNTCGFIDSAKQESIDAILEAAQLKTNGKAQRLVVAGCLVERYRDELKASMPEVDAFIGTSQINDILAVCDPQTNTRSLPITARAGDAFALRVHKDCRRLRSSLRFLFHSADAWPFSQPAFWLDRR